MPNIETLLRGCAGLVLAAALSGPAFAAPETPVTTQQKIVIGGKALAYVTETGRVPIRDAETGEPHGQMFYIAYRAPTKGPPRPVTFVWNGGPGANSATLHFEVVGPKRAEGTRLVDNAETWLADTDLVFVDPIGTGFSRPTKAEYADDFYGTVGDVMSVTEFVRAWRLSHGAEDAPLFLAGESWGSGRAGSVGYQLLKRGVPVNGLMLISGGTGLRSDNTPPELRAALKIVDLSVIALHHGKTPPELGSDPEALRKTVEAWARQTYAPALARAPALSEDERTAIIADLAKFSGMPVEAIDRKTISFTPRQYLTLLLKDRGQTLNVFDMRKTAGDTEDADRAILRYLRHDLGYATDLAYVGLEPAESGFAPSGKYAPSVGMRWNYATVPVTPELLNAAKAEAAARGGGPPSIGPPLPSTAEALKLNPKLKVLIAAGLYDSLNSCAANAEAESRLPPDQKAAASFKCYGGGHMMYRDAPARLQLNRDVKALIAAAR